jgi:serine phosphatase RsbU (regulator of sigma subunit)
MEPQTLTSPAAPGLLEWAVAARALDGQAQSGDLHLVKMTPAGALVAVVDALGHGAEAAKVALTAISTLERGAGEPVVTLLERCDRALRLSRGAVLSLAGFDEDAQTMTWVGVGNVEGVFLKADPTARPARESMLLRGGVVGYRLPSLMSSVRRVDPGDLLVLATDGIRSDFAEHVVWGAPAKAMADRLLERCGKGTDDALVLVVRYRGSA